MKAARTLYHGRKAMLQLIYAKAFGRRVPVRVSFLVTKRCNLSCFYCYAKDVLNAPQVKEMAIAELKDIVDQIYAAGCRWIDILGGEPLLRDDIEEFVDYARKKGIFMEITTNGFFVKKKISALKKIDHVCISLDGDKQANDRSRGEGSFEKITEGIEFAVKSGISVRVHATLCKRTMRYESLKFLADFCNRLKIRFNYSENGLPGIERLDPDFLLSEGEAVDFYQGYRALKKKGYPIISSDTAVGYAVKWPLPDETTIYKKDACRLPRNSFYPCQLGRTQCFINANADVYSCTKRWGQGKNIRKEGFRRAWDYLAELDCLACSELGTIEQSLITGLHLRAFFNSVMNFAL